MLNIANWDMKPIPFILFFQQGLTDALVLAIHSVIQNQWTFKWKKLNENFLSFCKPNFHSILVHSAKRLR